MSGRRAWRELRDRLRARPAVPTTVTHVVAVRDNASWRKPFTIMTVAGHRPTGLADACGGYLCACQQASWSNLGEYGPYGACPVGWYDAREFLFRYCVPEPLRVPVEDGDA